MSSRQEEKERRRAARLAAEQAEQKSVARGGRMRAIAIALAGFGVIVVAVILAVGGSGGGSDGGPSTTADVGFVDAAAPARQVRDLQQASRAAGCQVRNDRNYGSEHTTDPVIYKVNPPTSGPHTPSPAEDGAYPTGNQPTVEPTVHSLEHGRINIQWRPGTPARRIGQLKSVFDEKQGYHALLFENQTKMPYAVVATAWTKALICARLNDRTFDAIRAFRDAYTDRGPEFIP